MQQEALAEQPLLRRCVMCGEEKLRSEFSRAVSNRDGLQLRCKPCHREHFAESTRRSQQKAAAKERQQRAERRAVEEADQHARILSAFGSLEMWSEYLEWRHLARRRACWRTSRSGRRQREERRVRREANAWDGRTCIRCGEEWPLAAFLLPGRHASRRRRRTCRSCRTADRVRSNPGSGRVYFIQATISGAIKVGYARNENAAVARIAYLQVGNHEDLVLLGIVEGGRAMEKHLHARFLREHIRGEWFRPWEPLLDYVRAHARPIGGE